MRAAARARVRVVLRRWRVALAGRTDAAQTLMRWMNTCNLVRLATSCACGGWGAAPTAERRGVQLVRTDMERTIMSMSGQPQQFRSIEEWLQSRREGGRVLEE